MLWVCSASGIDALQVFDEPGRFSTVALGLCRMVGILYGLGSLFLTYRLGRRCAVPGAAEATGLLASFLLASSPWMIRTSVEFKPDSLLLWITLLGLTWALDLPTHPSWRAYLRAGLGVGLATGAKLNGVFLAPSVAIAALSSWSRNLRAGQKLLLQLGAAGLTAALVARLAYPWLDQTLFYFQRIRNHYHRHEQARSFFGMLGRLGEELLDPTFFGPLFGSLGIVGLVALAVTGFSRLRTPSAAGITARERLILASYPCCYALAMALTSRYPKSNNWVQVLPMVAIGAAFLTLAAIDGWRVRVDRVPRLTRGLLFVVIAGLGLQGSWTFAYSEIVQSTEQRLARHSLKRLQFTHPRLIAIDGSPEALPRIASGADSPATVVPMPGLASRPRDVLARFDQLIYPLARTSEPQGPAYRTLQQGLLPQNVLTFKSNWLSARGNEWVLLSHPWRPWEEAQALSSQGHELRRGHFPRWPAGTFVTVALEVFPETTSATLQVDSQRIALYACDVEDERRLFVSQRFPLKIPAAPFAIGLSRPFAEITVQAQQWLPPEASDPPSPPP